MPCTMPHDGWLRPPAHVQKFIDELSPNRRLLLTTRGLLSLRLSTPKPPDGDTFEWLHSSTADIPLDATWFIDGSMFDGIHDFGIRRRTGFAIVIVSAQHDLLACGRGMPPNWVKDAAGAEAWAFAVMLRMCPTVPRTTTDCLNIVKTIAGGRGKATAASSPLARIWATAFDILDDMECTAEDFEKVAWMPAHRGQDTIGQVVASEGRILTALEWWANRLVDALAKSAASPHRLAPEVRKLVETAAEALEYSLAKLGAVTYAANHYKIEVILADGTTTHSIKSLKRAHSKPNTSGQEPKAVFCHVCLGRSLSVWRGRCPARSGAAL